LSLHIACCRWVVAGCRCADSVQRQWALELTSAAAAHKKKHYSFAILTQFSRWNRRNKSVFESAKNSAKYVCVKNKCAFDNNSGEKWGKKPKRVPRQKLEINKKKLHKSDFWRALCSSSGPLLQYLSGFFCFFPTRYKKNKK